MWVHAQAASSEGTVSLVSSMVPSRFGDESTKAGGKCHSSTVLPDSSVVRVLARSVWGPWFESRSGHVLFSPL